jgi:tetratricopeptide (TPR) repeat protein
VAFDLYTRAKALRLSPIPFNVLANENLLQAVELLNQAVARDPAFLVAWCDLAATHDRLYFLGFDHTPARLAAAEAAVEKAKNLRPDAGETHLAIAQHRYRGYRDYDGERAEAIAQRTLPNDPLPFELLGFIDRRQGCWDESTKIWNAPLNLIREIFTRFSRFPELLGTAPLQRYGCGFRSRS